jgi:plasmid stabilization system protein ParE
MARQPQKLIVEYTRQALVDLDTIWDWNAETYGADHADAYVAFLRLSSDQLETQSALGRPVPTNPKFKYRLLRRRSKGAGHLVIYEVIPGQKVRILRYFHTAQDWHRYIAE